MLAQARFQVLVLPDRTQYEANSLGLGTGKEHDAFAYHTVTQQGRSLIEKNEIEPVAPHFPSERTRQTPNRVLGRRGTLNRLFLEQHRDIDVALAPRGAARPASVQISEAHRGIGGQARSEALAQGVDVFLDGVVNHARGPIEFSATPMSRNRQSRICAP